MNLLKVYILVQAGEGYTEDIIVGRNKIELIKKIEQNYKAEIIDTFNEESKSFCQSENDSLRKMVENHNKEEPGEYILECIEPIWQQWTLHIEEI